MGINIKNNIRKVDAKLVNATIDKYGASYPAQSPWRADGFNKVFVETEGANPTQKDFLEGNSSVYVYAIGSNIGSLLPYSLASFTNIKELYLFSPTMVNIGAIDNNYLTYLTDNDLKVYVPSDLLNSYITTYGGTGKHLENRFDEITDDYPLTVSGSGDLTSQELTNQLMNNYESVDRTNCTKLIIQGFTNVSSVLWGYDFSDILPNLNNNVWVNGVKFDFSVLNIVGSGTLTEIDIDNAISDIAISNRGGVLEVKISGYSDMSVALEYDYEDLPNLEYIWLDNVRYEKIISNNNYLIYDYLYSSSVFRFTISTFQINNVTKLKVNNIKTGWFFGFSSTQKLFIDGGRYIKWRKNNTNFSVANIPNAGNYKYDFEIDGDGTIKLKNITTNISYSVSTATIGALPNLYIGFDGTDGGMKEVGNFQLEVNNLPYYNLKPAKNLTTNKFVLYDMINNIEYEPNIEGVLGNKFWLNETYFYSLSNLEQEYNANLNQTFYLDYNGTLPSYPNYQLTYYTDINCTTSILPENMQSGNRYYVKAVLVTLVIQGSGTLTSSIVENAVEKAGSSVTKVIIPDTFTSVADNSLNGLGNTLVNLNTYEFYQLIEHLERIDTSTTNTDYGVKNLILHNVNAKWVLGAGDVKCIENINIYSSGSINTSYLAINNAYLKNIVFNEGITLVNAFSMCQSNSRLEKVIFPNSFEGFSNSQSAFPWSKNGLKLIFNSLTVPTLPSTSNFVTNSRKFYFRANILDSVMSANNWNTYPTSDFIGFFTYNGTLPTFTDYTPTFYEDEDCTIVISSGFVVGTQYYVKLQAI